MITSRKVSKNVASLFREVGECFREFSFPFPFSMNFPKIAANLIFKRTSYGIYNPLNYVQHYNLMIQINKRPISIHKKLTIELWNILSESIRNSTSIIFFKTELNNKIENVLLITRLAAVWVKYCIPGCV